MRGEIVEVGAVPRKAREREDRHARAVVGKVETCAIWGVEFGHWMDLASSGIAAMSLITRAGQAYNLSPPFAVTVQ